MLGLPETKSHRQADKKEGQQSKTGSPFFISQNRLNVRPIAKDFGPQRHLPTLRDINLIFPNEFAACEQGRFENNSSGRFS